MDIFGHSVEVPSIPQYSYLLYWIRAEHHTDITNQGYVGITSNPKARFYGHSNSFKDFEKSGISKQRKLHNAVMKHKGCLEIDFVCVSDESYISSLEERLRPFPNIGWNIAQGGLHNSRSGRELSDDEKAHLRSIHTGRDISENQRQAISEKLKGKPLSETHKHNIREGMKSVDRKVLKDGGAKGINTQQTIINELGEAADLLWNRVSGNLYHSPYGVFINMNTLTKVAGVKSAYTIRSRMDSENPKFTDYYEVKKGDCDYDDHLQMFKDRVCLNE